ncbi:MAG: bifunctional 3-demethylubiquinol 3-O-methyltransferase/2-polyprenyl-6-hydroxyphenol methylase [Rhodospirillaceae bacterium]|jgi:2-polyprenyl-6-hydroxyphenyl methylase/3-demethylubiquinone-9 3-methyltransferase|nr:bifunctional 3-demethylubiquinol 3-O-methyltransferase/2-polyprenyl-6-hydroxyphenol methylase [Rhodospirillaceae bacterium]|tara:strand:- start:1209 stop:1976 length:768 start_codon:yes stop_codon:yes gene_type:complete
MARTAKAKSPKRGASTAEADEIARFAAIAESWWDPAGDFRPLHRLNPARLEFIRDHGARHFGRDPLGPGPFKGLSVLDIGCGGGLLSEPMRRLGAAVTGIDAGQEAIEIAKAHARQSGLDIGYRHRLPEELDAEKGRFDLVLNMEVVEHVADLGAFLAASAGLVKPGGAMVLSTLNRTLKALALAKIGAEYVLRWLPRGTHDWRKFVRPSELAAGLRSGGVDITGLKGMSYDPIGDEWRLSGDLAVNYLAFAVKR